MWALPRLVQAGTAGATATARAAAAGAGTPLARALRLLACAGYVAGGTPEDESHMVFHCRYAPRTSSRVGAPEWRPHNGAACAGSPPGGCHLDVPLPDMNAGPHHSPQPLRAMDRRRTALA